LYSPGVRILVAPDKFRGTLTARQAAEAVEAGWRRARPDDDIELVPMADGGEGTMEALIEALGGRIEQARVAGPLGEPVDAAYGVASSPTGALGVVEMARASGLALLAEARRDPMRATTRGTGELMSLALDAGVERLVVCIGGSATNDGGAGMAAALGARLLDLGDVAVRDLLDLHHAGGRVLSSNDVAVDRQRAALLQPGVDVGQAKPKQAVAAAQVMVEEGERRAGGESVQP
jgi:glycerate kinase